MSKFRRFLSRRWLLACLGIAALLFGLAMLHPYPRQSLFGPTIRGKPWCVWEAATRRFVHRHKSDRALSEKILHWVGVDLENLDVGSEVLNDAEFLPLLLVLAEDRDHEVRWYVLSNICNGDQLQHPSACPVLRRCLQLDDSNDRIEAAVALWRIEKDQRALDLVLRELNDTNQPRAIVIRYFETICEESPEFYRHFLPLARDPNWWIRSRALRVLFILGKPALPVLCQGLEAPQKEVRLAAVGSLWSLGENAKAAIPALERCLRDSEKKVRRHAALALKQIEPESFKHLIPEPLE